MNDCSLIPWHPIAACFPIFTDVCALAASIRSGGLRQPITLLDGKILDGRARHIACSMAGYELTPADYDHWYGSASAATEVVVAQYLSRADPFNDFDLAAWLGAPRGSG